MNFIAPFLHNTIEYSLRYFNLHNSGGQLTIKLK